MMKRINPLLLMLVLLVNAANPASSNADEQPLYPNTPAVPPDGSLVAFSYAGDIWTVSIDGGRATRITTQPGRDDEPVFSPDGKAIAFVSNRTGSAQIYTVSVNGGQPTQLTHHTAGYSLQDWSADGKELLTVAARDHHWRRPNRLIQVSATERSAEHVVADAYADYGRLSPDGSKVLLVREGMEWTRKGYVGARAQQLWLYDIREGSFERLVEEDTPCHSPVWKPDGSGCYFVRESTGAGNLWSYDFESGDFEQLTHYEDDPVLFPAVARDGSVIVYRHQEHLYRFDPAVPQQAPSRIEIRCETDREDRTIRRTLTSTNAVAASADGLDLFFAAGGDIWAMDTELKEPVAIASTPFEEREPVLVDSDQKLLFIREYEGQVDIYSATRADKELYWWQNTEFAVEQLTKDADTEHRLTLSPDGKRIAFVKGRGDLYVSDLEFKSPKLIAAGFSAPDFDFSPDGRWIAWSHEDEDFNDEVWIAPLDGSREPFNVSRHPDDDWSPRWSSDGRVLAFLGRRNAEEIDVYYVFLSAADHEESSRDRTLEKAIKKLESARGKSAPAKKEETKAASKPEGDGEKEADSIKSEDEKEDSKKADQKLASIDFEGLHERIRRVSIPDSSESNLFWFGDGKTLAFQAKVSGKTGTYSVEIPDRLSAKLLTSSTGTAVRRLKDAKKVAWLSSGKPGTLSVDAKTESFAFKAYQQMDQSGRYRATFNMAWRLMRDNWYDPAFNNRNWDAVRRKYIDAAEQAHDEDAISQVVSLMLGELNGSHLGFGAYTKSLSSDWQIETAHLGVTFDPSYKGPGLRIKSVIENGPADRDESKIAAGEVLTAIEGEKVDPAMDLTKMLNGRLERDIELSIENSDGESRTVSIRPISYSSARSLLYPQFEKETRNKVEELSNGRLGYLHIERMDDGSFRDFERELYNAGYGKDGLVIDVRENGGGFTADHLLTALTQPRHAITVPRGGGPGYPHDRKIYATWNKPIVVLCNQNSFSNAEIFSHAIKTLKRGQVVGVPTAGGVISTGSAQVMDVGYLRQPFRGWYVLPTGEDMELNGAVPHHIVWPHPGELPAGVDRQLEKAVEVLKRDVRRAKRKQQPALKNASERQLEQKELG